MKTCFIYARTATKETLRIYQNEKILSQIKGCQKYAEQNNYVILGIFTDIGKSGADLNRIGLKKLLTAGSKHPHSAVMVYKIHHLTRNVVDWNLLRQKLKNQKNNLISVAEGIFNEEGSTLISNIFASVAQWEFERNKSI